MDPRMTNAPTDAERYPTLTAAGHQTLKFMREHPCAPIYRKQSGNRLTSQDITELLAFENKLANSLRGPDQADWIPDFISEVYADVPHYQALGSAPARLEDIQPVSRGDLAADIARFVPNTVSTQRMINFQTTGTTGHPMLIPSHPQVAGRYLAFHKEALKRFGITLEFGAGQVGVVLLGNQRNCFTYTSVTPMMDESGLAKINLHSDDWRDPDHRAAYINALNPEVIAGDPLSFEAFLDLNVTCVPKALLSVSMMMTTGLRNRLEQRFACPVLDLYSMNEVGPIGVFDSKVDGHVLLQHQLHVEILDDKQQPVALGDRGEIVVTGGFNFCLPLLRYRTGDYGALKWIGREGLIVGLQGREPVLFRGLSGEWFNNVDVSHALKALPTAQFGVHQNADGSLILRLSASSMRLCDQAKVALFMLLGVQDISVDSIAAEGKFLQYTTDLARTA
jgi:phenylacetate-CoA ligase